SLCRQMMDLEDELGTKLFWRNRHQVVLTESGRAFLEGACQTLKCASQTIESTRQTASEQNGELRIASIGLMCSSVLIDLMRAFRDRCPRVQVSILEQYNHRGAQEALQEAQFAIGYLANDPRKSKVATLKSCVIATRPVGIATTKGVGAKNGSAASLRDF